MCVCTCIRTCNKIWPVSVCCIHNMYSMFDILSVYTFIIIIVYV